MTFKLTKAQLTNINNKFNLSLPLKFRRFDDGVVNHVYELENYVMKINTGLSYIPRIQKEYKALKMFEKTPEPVCIDLSKKIIPYEYFIMKKLRGEHLRNNLTDKKILEQIGVELKKIHKKKFDVYQNGKTFKEDLFFMLNRDLNEAVRTKEITIQEKSNILLYFKKKNFHYNKKASFCHGDVNLENVFVKNGAIEAFIDWEWCHKGNAELEIARFMHDKLKTELLINAFLKGYGKLSKHFWNNYEDYNFLYILRVLPSVSTLRNDVVKNKYRNLFKKSYKKLIHLP